MSGTSGRSRTRSARWATGTTTSAPIGVSVSGSHVAAVSASGTELYVAPTEAPDGEVDHPVTGAVDLARPTGTTATGSGCWTAAPGGRG